MKVRSICCLLWSWQVKEWKFNQTQWLRQLNCHVICHEFGQIKEWKFITIILTLQLSLFNKEYKFTRLHMVYGFSSYDWLTYQNQTHHKEERWANIYYLLKNIKLFSVLEKKGEKLMQQIHIQKLRLRRWDQYN